MIYKSLNKDVLRGLVALFLLASSIASAQSLTGTRGLIKAPTARMYESGTLAIGMGYVPSKFFVRTSGPNYGIRSGNAGLNTFVTAYPLPFMEIMFRYSHELNMSVSPQNQYFPDRMFTARFKLLEENKYIPSIILGLQDISGALKLTSEGANFYTSTYIVASKKIELQTLEIDLSIGFGFNYGKIKSKEFNGIFGGFELKHKEFDLAQLLIDYDTTSINLGLQGYLYNRFNIVLGLMDFKPMYILAYRYKI